MKSKDGKCATCGEASELLFCSLLCTTKKPELLVRVKVDEKEGK